MFQYPSINGYFLKRSNGRFFWSRGATIGPLSFLASEAHDAVNNDGSYASNIVYRAMASGQFNFSDYDANHDGHITVDELAILIINNDLTGCRTAGVVRSADLTFDWGGGSTHCNVGLVNDADPFAVHLEEFEETLGCQDIYGVWSEECLSGQLSPQSCAPSDWNALYYLDPWHRMQLGWCEPRIQSLTAGGIITIPAAQVTDPSSPVILYDPAVGPSEFFLLEYRTHASPSGAGYDANVADDGLAIWHVHQEPNHSPTLVPRYDAGPLPAQENWRFCKKCKGIHYITAWQNPQAGPCPKDGTHDVPSGPGYQIVQNIANAPGQHGWKWCKKCQGLFYAPATAQSHCPAGGTHDGSLSGDYSLVDNDTNSPGQHGWKWCSKCQGLFYGPNMALSYCPADHGFHDDSASGDYAMLFGGSNLVVWAEGPPTFKRGGNTLWHSDQTTPRLVLLNGAGTSTHLHVRPFPPGAGSITVEWLSERDTWVDFNSLGLFPDGSFNAPYPTLADGITYVSYGGILNFKPGSSSVTTNITKPMTLKAYNGPVTIGR